MPTLTTISTSCCAASVATEKQRSDSSANRNPGANGWTLRVRVTRAERHATAKSRMPAIQ